MIKEYLERQFANFHSVTSGVVTPQMFGAKADGITNDTQAVKNAIKNGSVIYFPEGTYLIDWGTVRLPNLSSKRIFGAGSQKSIIRFNENHARSSVTNGKDGMLLFFSDNQNLSIQDIGFVYDNNDNNVVYPTENDVEAESVLLIFSGVMGDVAIDNCYFHIGGSATVLPKDTLMWGKLGAKTLKITNCLFENFTNREVGGCIWITPNDKDGNEDLTINELTIANNELRNTNKDEAIGIWSLGGHTEFNIKNILITDNVAIRKNWNGTAFDFSDNVFTIYHNARANVAIESNVVVTNNTVISENVKTDVVRVANIIGGKVYNNRIVINSIYGSNNVRFINTRYSKAVVKDNYCESNATTGHVMLSSLSGDVDFIGNVVETKGTNIWAINSYDANDGERHFNYVNNTFILNGYTLELGKRGANHKINFSKNKVKGNFAFNGNMAGTGLVLRDNTFNMDGTTQNPISFNAQNMIFEDNEGVAIVVDSSSINKMDSFKYRGDMENLKFKVNNAVVDDSESVRARFFTDEQIIYYDAEYADINFGSEVAINA